MGSEHESSATPFPGTTAHPDPVLGNAERSAWLPPRAPAGPARSRMRFLPVVLTAIATGGALGTCARVWVTQDLLESSSRFPWATFTVNVTGSFVLGFMMILVLDRLPPTRLVRPLLATGVCGAYTTFSTLVTGVDLLVRADRILIAVLYVVSSVADGLVAVVGGMGLARRIPLGRDAA